MGWFFGCFGRRNKNPKSAQHGDQNLLLPQPLPFSSPSPSQPPPIPIKKLNPSKEQGFLRTRPLATSAPPIRAGYDVLLQENAKNVSTKNGARKKAEDPWSQVDDLAEELEDLRKQIEKGTTTARESCNNQITEEVTFLKSCGALPQSPADLKKKDEEMLSISSYSKGWHSWLLPLSSNPSPGPAKQPLIGKKNVSVRGLQVASSSSTPAKQKGSGILHRHNEIIKDNLQIGLGVASEHTNPRTEELQTRDADMGFMLSTPISHKNLKNVSGNRSALTKQIEEHKRHISFMDESFSTGNVRTTSSKSIDLPKASQSPADQIISQSAALIPPHTQGEADEAIKSLEQAHDLCDSVVSKKGPTGFVSSPAIGNHRYAAVDSTVSASQVLSESSSCSTTAENSCESPSGSISSSFDAESCCIKSNESCPWSGRIVSLSKSCEGTQRDLSQYRRLTCEDSATSSTNGVASTPNQKNGSRKSVLPNDRRYAVDEENIENSFLSGRNIQASSKCIDSDASSPQQRKQLSTQSATTVHHEMTAMACLKPQRIRNQPQSPVLTPVENEFQWKKLQEKGNQRMKTVDPVASSATSWRSTDAAVAKTSLKTTDPTVPTKRDVLGSIDNNNIVSGTAAVVSVTASFSEWSKPAPPMEDEESSRKRIQHDETLTKDSIAVDMSLSHWLNPTPPLLSIHDAGLGCTPRNGLPRPLPLPAIQAEGSPKFSQSERPILIQPSPMLGPIERPVSGQSSPKCSQQFERPSSGCFSGYRHLNNSATPKLHWDGLGIPNTTTKYNEDQMVKWFSSPFEVRLERELDKQKDGLQKRLFGRPT